MQDRIEKECIHLWYLGNALLDFSANCKPSMLEKYKLVADDNCEYSNDQKGLFEELLKKSSVVMTPGGSAQNSARVSRWIIPNRDSSVTFVGCLGCDSYGEILRSKVESAGVIACYDYHPTEPTGTTAGLVTSVNQRTLCARLGAATKFQKTFLKSAKAAGLIRRADILYAEGFFLSHGQESVSDVADFALQNHKIFAFNVSAVFIAEKYFPFVHELLPKIDILFGNSKEITTLACKIDKDASNIDKAVKLLVTFPTVKDKTKRIVVATDGPNPTVCCVTGSGVLHYPVMPVDHVEDTIGAGDAFVGAFLPVWYSSKNLELAVMCGNEMARLVVQTKGCVLPTAVPSAISRFL